MAGGNDEPERIVRCEVVHNAPTGEADRYVTNYGRVWQRTPAHESCRPPQTGVTRGVRVGNAVYPRNH